MINEQTLKELKAVKLNISLAKKILKSSEYTGSEVMTNNIENRISGIVRHYLVKKYEHGTCFRMIDDKMKTWTSEELKAFIPIIRSQVNW
jgi:hypothetical protein